MVIINYIRVINYASVEFSVAILFDSLISILLALVYESI